MTPASASTPLDPTSGKSLAAVPASDEATHEALVLRHLPQVQQVARSIAAGLPGNVVLADLVGAGMLGLINAVSKFDPTRDATLSTYAQFRIRGAILDSLRSQDWAPRRLRLMGRRVSDARHELASMLFRLPTESEMATHLGVTLSDYQAHRAASNRLLVQSFADPDPDAGAEEGSLGPALEDVPSPHPNALEILLGKEETNRLAAAVEALPSAEHQVVTLYYLEELTMREVGLAMDISES
ncbi:MAG: sigma-70 family RNA polymerase sigma factor, partial [Terriglobales bacterium]